MKMKMWIWTSGPQGSVNRRGTSKYCATFTDLAFAEKLKEDCLNSPSLKISYFISLLSRNHSSDWLLADLFSFICSSLFFHGCLKKFEVLLDIS